MSNSSPVCKFDVSDRLSDSDMQLIAQLVYAQAGVVLDNSKKALVVSRLAKRVGELKLGSYRDYVNLLCSKRDPSETQRLINAITTNKTSFFREPYHFDFLRDQVSALLARATGAGGRRTLRIWSAGCSTGQEPYSIAMTVARVLGHHLASWDVRIIATDIDSEVLATAEKGVYAIEHIEEIPAPMHVFLEPTEFTDSKGRSFRAVRESVRKLISFQQLNFVAPSWPALGQFDHIFCRNVTIYFDQRTQSVLYPRLVAHLTESGSFYAGHSENLSWLPELLVPIGPTIYGRAKTSGRTRSSPGSVPSTSSGSVTASTKTSAANDDRSDGTDVFVSASKRHALAVVAKRVFETHEAASLATTAAPREHASRMHRGLCCSASSENHANRGERPTTETRQGSGAPLCACRLKRKKSSCQLHTLDRGQNMAKPAAAHDITFQSSPAREASCMPLLAYSPTPSDKVQYKYFPREVVTNEVYVLNSNQSSHIRGNNGMAWVNQ